MSKFEYFIKLVQVFVVSSTASIHSFSIWEYTKTNNEDTDFKRFKLGCSSAIHDWQGNSVFLIGKFV